MYFFNVLFLAIFLFSTVAWAEQNPAAEVEKLIDAGEYKKAEDTLNKFVSSEPNNATYHQLLGDTYRKEGRLDDALAEYEKAKRLGGENPELLKSIGTTYKWKKQYREAAQAYRAALRKNPKDEEAKQDIESLERNRGLKVSLMAGGWEVDNTREKYEGMLSYGGLDKLDLNAGYSYANYTYYKRHKVYANGYYFYDPRSYFKTNLSYKDYNYPAGPTQQPDSNAYDKVPSIEFEVSHWFANSFRGTLAYEFFRPSFFFDTGAHANNNKLSTELYYITPLDWLRLKLMYALLVDPDPNKTTIKGRSLNMPLGQVATSTSVKYQTQSLLGGGAEFVKGKWNAELKYIPNRDLDRSYSWSVFAGAGYDFTDKITGRFDYLHDKYSSRSAFSGKTANVYLASLFYKWTQSVDLGVGYKYIELPTKNENAGFLTVAYKTGLGF